MVDLLMGFTVGVLAGTGLGILIMRNNYKSFKATEEEFKALVMDKRLTAAQVVARLRNKVGI
jgi:hypothetical protein